MMIFINSIIDKLTLLFSSPISIFIGKHRQIIHFFPIIDSWCEFPGEHPRGGQEIVGPFSKANGLAHQRWFSATSERGEGECFINDGGEAPVAEWELNGIWVRGEFIGIYIMGFSGFYYNLVGFYRISWKFKCDLMGFNGNLSVI